MIEDHVGRLWSYVGSCVEHVGRCSQRTRGEEASGRFERKKVIGDESIRYSDGKISDRTLWQLCKAIPCSAKIWLNSEARRADVRYTSRKSVQTYYRGQHPPMQELQSKLITWNRRYVKCHVDHMLFGVNGRDWKKQMCKMQAIELQPQTILERSWVLRSIRPLGVEGNWNAIGWDIAKAAH